MRRVPVFVVLLLLMTFPAPRLAAATPDALVVKIHDAIDKALENPDVQKQLSISDIPGKPMPLTDLSALMRADYEKLNKVVKTSGMALQ